MILVTSQSSRGKSNNPRQYAAFAAWSINCSKCHYTLRKGADGQLSAAFVPSDFLFLTEWTANSDIYDPKKMGLEMSTLILFSATLTRMTWPESKDLT